MSSLEGLDLILAKGVAVVECKGVHDIATRGEIATLLERLLAEYELVVVDISEAKFIDSSFVNNLFIADGFARKRGRRFRLQHATEPVVRKMLESARVLEKLDCAGSREEALR